RRGPGGATRAPLPSRRAARRPRQVGAKCGRSSMKNCNACRRTTGCRWSCATWRGGRATRPPPPWAAPPGGSRGAWSGGGRRRRGLARAGGAAIVLAESALAAPVPPLLAVTTPRVALRLAAGGVLRECGVSGTVARLTEGGLALMGSQKLVLVLVLVLAL